MNNLKLDLTSQINILKSLPRRQAGPILHLKPPFPTLLYPYIQNTAPFKEAAFCRGGKVLYGIHFLNQPELLTVEQKI